MEKILRDPKWIGTSPSNPFWSYDSRQLFFNWNPDKGVSDSLYSISLDQRIPRKVTGNLAPYPMEDHAFIEPGSWTDEYKRIFKLFKSTLKYAFPKVGYAR